MAEKYDNIKTNRVLALSGGGVKGVAEIMVLMEIEARTGKSISELFPIISGTSVGGLIAALLTIPKEPGSKEAKYSAKDAFEIFTSNAGNIFPKTFLGSVKQLFTHKYSQKPLKELLEKYLEDNRMDDTTSRLVIPVNALTHNGGGLEIFDSSDSYSPHVRVKDVLLATTAAPTFFKPIMDKNAVQGYEYASGTPYVYADGGLDANRPANEVLKLLKKGHTREEQKKILDSTMVCALNFVNDIEPTNSIPKIGFDGIINWLLKGKLVSRLMTNKEAASTAEVENDLPEENEFFVVGLPITKETESLDNASPENIKKLEEIGRKYVKDNDELIQKLCDTLLDNLNKEQAANQVADSDDEGIEEDIDEQVTQDLGSDDEGIGENIVNKQVAQDLDSDDEGIEEDIDEQVTQDICNKEEVNVKTLNEFSNKKYELKDDYFLHKAENYTLEEIENCIRSFEEASLKWQQGNQNNLVFSYSIEEDIALEGEERTDGVPGYNEIVA